MRMTRSPRYIKSHAHFFGFMLMMAAGLVALFDCIYPEEQTSLREAGPQIQGYLPADPQSESRQKRETEGEAEEDDERWFDYSSSDGVPQPLHVDQLLPQVDPYSPKFVIPITRRVDPEIKKKLIIYNSVAKSGSSIMRNLIEKIAVKNEYRYLNGVTDLLRKRFFTSLEEDVLSRTLLNVATPALYSKTMFYVNFTKFGYIQPTYISLIRDPTLSKLSRYYRGGGKNSRNMSIETCMQAADPECTFNAKVMISRNPEPPDYSAEIKIEGLLPYFCGNEYKCRMAYSLWTLQRAKESIERNYAVVGTLENFEDYLKVLQHKLPLFFKGIYDEFKASGIQIDSTPTRSLISDQGYALLKKRLHLENDFYDFIVQRLAKQVQEIGS